MQSIFHVSFLRGLFPEGHYRTMPLQNLEGAQPSHICCNVCGAMCLHQFKIWNVAGMTIRMLTPACAESKRLIDWVETGKRSHCALQLHQACAASSSDDATTSDVLQACMMRWRSGISRCATCSRHARFRTPAEVLNNALLTIPMRTATVPLLAV